MRAMGVEHLIVTSAQGIQGVVSETDLARACSSNPETPVGELAVAVPIVDSDAPVQEAANLMRDRKVGCLPVVDGLTLAGVVTIERLLDLIGHGTVQAGKRHR
jgi:acetoin utilization protein AcuB